MFQKAVKTSAYLRLAIEGLSGGGKTFNALRTGERLAEKCGGRMAVIDSERGSASKYADLFDFDCVELADSHSPREYIAAINAAEEAGYKVLVIDSLTHAWSGKDGALELADKITAKSGNYWASWRKVTPLHDKLVDTILQSAMHIIVTMRMKTETAMEKDDNGKTVIQKHGMKPIMRDGIEYEFDVVLDVDRDHIFTASKTRCPALDDLNICKPKYEIADALYEWLRGKGEPVARKPAPKLDNSAEDKKAKATPEPQGRAGRTSNPPGGTPKAEAGSPSPDGELTAKDVSGALSAWQKACGVNDTRETVKKFLEPHGATKLKDTPAEKYPEIISAVAADLKEGEIKYPPEVQTAMQKIAHASANG